jgi:diaminopimelate epimerase
MNTLPFTKMHGLGNDYLIVNGFEHDAHDPETLSVVMSDRRHGAGADGLIVIAPADDLPGEADAHFRMRIYNADGSEAEMCGNGVRCCCKYAHDRGLTDANPMRIATGAGVLTNAYTLGPDGSVESVTVDMGAPEWNMDHLPVDAAHLAAGDDPHTSFLSADGASWAGVIISMGNPHLVLFADTNPAIDKDPLNEFDLARLGPLLEHHPAFPQRINIHIVRVASRTHLRMRTWERGSGITLACGTGAAAVCAAAVLTDRADRAVAIDLPGGRLDLHWDQSTGRIMKTGPATFVYDGAWPLK